MAQFRFIKTKIACHEKKMILQIKVKVAPAVFISFPFIIRQCFVCANKIGK